MTRDMRNWKTNWLLWRRKSKKCYAERRMRERWMSLWESHWKRNVCYMNREAAKKDLSSSQRGDRSSIRSSSRSYIDDRHRQSDFNETNKLKSLIVNKKKWRKNRNERWISHVCWHYDEWHLNSNYPKKPPNYYLIDQLIADSNAFSNDKHDIDLIFFKTKSNESNAHS